MGCCSSKENAPKPGSNGFRSSQPYRLPQTAAQPLKVSSQQPHNQPPPTRPQPQQKAQPPPQPRAQPQQPNPPPVKPAAPPNSILGKPFDDIKQYYTLGKELGRGQSGITYLCTENYTGHNYACKSILKREFVSENNRDDIKREIQIMQHLSGQPNIVEIKGAYEDRYFVHLVMELCAGGDLFDRIIAQGQYSERAAAAILRDIVNVVHICHFKGVVHRDLKPDNFLLSSKDEKAMLKVTDFELSVFIEEGKMYSDMAGTACYVAPEVLRRSYGKEIDIWSAGVILYVLLGGAPPFWAKTRSGIFNAILEGVIHFDSQPWPSISDSAKDLVRKMLTQDPRKRITSAEILVHPWLRVGRVAPDKPIVLEGNLNPDD